LVLEDGLFWSGLTRREQRIALVCTVLAISITIGGPWVATHSHLWGAVAAFTGLVASSFAGSIYSERFLAVIRRKGYPCENCGCRIGLSDAQEAFRVAGRLGELPEEVTFFAECQRCAHRSPIPWRDAWEEMCEHLQDLAVDARAISAGHARNDDQQKRAEAAREGEFADKAFALARRVELGTYEYANLEQVRATLQQFRRSRWPRAHSDRERLYTLLAAILRMQRLTGE
jgi:hypothetical protein